MGGVTSRGKIRHGVETEARIPSLPGGSRAHFHGFSSFIEGGPGRAVQELDIRLTFASISAGFRWGRCSVGPTKYFEGQAEADNGPNGHD